MKYKFLIGLIVLCFVFGVFILQMNQINDLRHQNTQTVIKYQKQIDSLDSELFSTSIELNRYRIALDIFRETNPTSAEVYENILSTQTE